MTQGTHTAGRQATAGYPRAVSRVWSAPVAVSVGCPTTIQMTAKPGIGAFADHANLPSRRPKESSP
jgi:hypothetical protein